MFCLAHVRAMLTFVPPTCSFNVWPLWDILNVSKDFLKCGPLVSVFRRADLLDVGSNSVCAKLLQSCLLFVTL